MDFNFTVEDTESSDNIYIKAVTIYLNLLVLSLFKVMIKLTNYCISYSLSDIIKCSSINFFLLEIMAFSHLVKILFSSKTTSFLIKEKP